LWLKQNPGTVSNRKSPNRTISLWITLIISGTKKLTRKKQMDTGNMIMAVVSRPHREGESTRKPAEIP
jgi:hypothetical protein